MKRRGWWDGGGGGGVKLMTHLKFSTIFNYDVVWGGGGVFLVCLSVCLFIGMC
jgi:hypothetical protein